MMTPARFRRSALLRWVSSALILPTLLGMMPVPLAYASPERRDTLRPRDCAHSARCVADAKHAIDTGGAGAAAPTALDEARIKIFIREQLKQADAYDTMVEKIERKFGVTVAGSGLELELKLAHAMLSIPETTRIIKTLDVLRQGQPRPLELVRYEVRGQAAIIRLNRPEKKNAATPQLLGELREARRRAITDPAVKAIIVTGEGDTFMSGADLNITRAITTETAKRPWVELRQTTSNEIADTFRASGKRVIFAMNGATYGGGLELALSADYRLALDSAQMGLTETALGLFPAWGGTQRLPRLVKRAWDGIVMIVNARIIKAPEAKALGIVDHVVANQAELEANIEAIARGELPAMPERKSAAAFAQELRTTFQQPRVLKLRRGEVDPSAKISVPPPFERDAAVAHRVRVDQAALDAMEAGAENLPAGLAAELDGNPKVTVTPETQALLKAFLEKQPRPVIPLLPAEPAAAPAEVAPPAIADQPVRVGKIAYVPMSVAGFEQLTLHQKLLAYHLSQAAALTNELFADQIHPDNLAIMELLDQILAHASAPAEALPKIREFRMQVQVNRGIYRTRRMKKMLLSLGAPPMTSDELRQAAHNALEHGAQFRRLAVSDAASLDRALDRLIPLLYDPSVQPLVTDEYAIDRGDDPLQMATNAGNFYRGVTTAEARAFYADTSRDTVRHPLNSRLVKDPASGAFVEEVYRAGDPSRGVPPGRAAETLQQMIAHLREAQRYAEGKQHEALGHLIEYFTTGDPEAWRLYNAAWVESTPIVDFAIGPIEAYHDPLHIKGSWQGAVYVRSSDLTERAQKLLDHLNELAADVPGGALEARPPSAVLANAIALAGDSGPADPYWGQNLPNELEFRAQGKIKNLAALVNAVSSFDAGTVAGLDSNAFLRATTWDPVREAALKPWRRAAITLLVSLHEMAGHGIGEVRWPGTAFEETWADAMALYQITDPRLRPWAFLTEEEAAHQRDLVEAAYRYYLQRAFTNLRHADPTTGHLEAHDIARHLIVSFLIEQGSVEIKERDGQHFFAMKSVDAMREGLARLVKRMRAIKVMEDQDEAKQQASALVDMYAKKHLDLQPEIKARSTAWGMVEQVVPLPPVLTLVKDDSDHVIDVHVALATLPVLDRNVLAGPAAAPTLRPIKKVLVVGGGQMGAAFAYTAALNGLTVVVRDVDQAALERAKANVERHIKTAQDHPRARLRLKAAGGPEGILSRITFESDLAQAAKDVDVAFEAVFEDPNVKTDVFRQLDALLPDDVVVFTNTSSIKVETLASARTRAPRMVGGLHFFDPVPSQRVVEVVRREDADPRVEAQALILARMLGREPVRVKDSPLFAFNRMIVPVYNEQLRMAEEGIERELINAAAEDLWGLGAGFFWYTAANNDTRVKSTTALKTQFNAARLAQAGFGNAFYAPPQTLQDYIRETDGGQRPWARLWTIDRSKTFTPEQLEPIKRRLLGVAFTMAAQSMDEGIVLEDHPLNVIDSGVHMTFSWRTKMFALMNEMGTRNALTLVQDTLARYPSLTMPASLQRLAERDQPWPIEYVHLDITDGVATLTLDRPEVMNPLNEQVVRDFRRHAETIRERKDVRAIILRGKGSQAFVAGADLKFFLDNGTPEHLSRIVDFTRDGQTLLRDLEQAEPLTLSRIEGFAFGGGLETALATRLIVAGPKALFGAPETTSVGIAPGLGATRRLTQKIGRGAAKWMILTGAMVNAKLAYQLGLVDILADDPTVVQAKLEELAQAGPVSREALLAAFPRSPPALEPDLAAVINAFDHDSLADIIAHLTPLATDGSKKAQHALDALNKAAPVALALANDLINTNASDSAILAGMGIFLFPDAKEGLQKPIGAPRAYTGAPPQDAVIAAVADSSLPADMKHAFAELVQTAHDHVWGAIEPARRAAAERIYNDLVAGQRYVIRVEGEALLNASPGAVLAYQDAVRRFQAEGRGAPTITLEVEAPDLAQFAQTLSEKSGVAVNAALLSPVSAATPRVVLGSQAYLKAQAVAADAASAPRPVLMALEAAGGRPTSDSPIVTRAKELAGIVEESKKSPGPQVDEKLYAYGTQPLSKETVITAPSLADALQQFYAGGVDDENLPPIVLVDEHGRADTLEDGEPVIFVDFRTDRLAEPVAALSGIRHRGQAGQLSAQATAHPNVPILTMTHVDDAFTAPDLPPEARIREAYPAEGIRDTYSEVIGREGIHQERNTETEKAPAMLWFLSGRKDLGFPNQEQAEVINPGPDQVTVLRNQRLPITGRIVKSRQVGSHVLAPQMRAAEITDLNIDSLRRGVQQVDTNIPNADMVGHAMKRVEDFPAVVQAIRTIDEQLERQVRVALDEGYVVIITADHGNAEEMLDAKGRANPKHSKNQVPFIVLGLDADESAALRPDANIGNLAPTMMQLRGLTPPASWNRRSAFTAESQINGRKDRKIFRIILDGYGIRAATEGNAMAAAEQQVQAEFHRSLHINRWLRGEDGAVSAPATAAGAVLGYDALDEATTEYGHIHFDSGYDLYTDKVVIDRAIDDGSFYQHPQLREMMRLGKERGRLRLRGIISDGNVHSSLKHWDAVLQLARDSGLRGDQVKIEFITDGRDVHPQSAPQFVQWLEDKMAEYGVGKIVRIVGRQWAKDRDQRWRLIEADYRSATEATAAVHVRVQPRITSTAAALENALAVAASTEPHQPPPTGVRPLDGDDNFGILVQEPTTVAPDLQPTTARYLATKG